MLLYTLVLWPVALAPAWFGLAGFVYLGTALVLSLLFTMAAIRVWRDAGDTSAKRMFGFSILYLFLLFAVMILDRAPGIVGGLAAAAGGA
jgi:protoheme IX farnesyltransferase